MTVPADDSTSRWQPADATLMQRVVDHVHALQGDGLLPALDWHDTLSEADRQALRMRWPEACARWDLPASTAVAPARAGDEPELLRPLRDLLIAHRSGDEPETRALANLIGAAAFGPHHLWEDLGATGRAEVRHLLSVGFTRLHDLNRRNLRWKRHFFLLLGDDLGRADLRPPKCEGCSDHAICFGSPEGAAAAARPGMSIASIADRSV